MKSNKIIHIFWISISLAVTACANLSEFRQGYDGERLPPSQEALIYGIGKETTNKGSKGDLALFSCLDGDRLGMTWNTPHPERLAVLPGPHYIDIYVGALGGLKYAREGVWLIAKPGHQYQVRLMHDFQNFRVWIEDQRTGEKVGGLVGSEPSDKFRNVEKC